MLANASSKELANHKIVGRSKTEPQMKQVAEGQIVFCIVAKCKTIKMNVFNLEMAILGKL